MKRLLFIIFLSLSLCFPVYGADQKISELTDLAAKPASDDELVIFDSSTGLTKKVDYTYFEDIKNVNLYGGLTAAVGSIGATETTLLITDSQTIVDDLSIPTTMQLVVTRGGDISVVAGKVLTINGTISAGAYQIFSGTGIVTFSGTGLESGAWDNSGDVYRGTWSGDIKDYSETKTAPTSAAGVLTLNIENGNVFAVTLTENVTTLTISNPSASGSACSFTLILTQAAAAKTVAWGGSVRWADSTAPTISTNSAIYVFTFVTIDGGTIWYGFFAGSEMGAP